MHRNPPKITKKYFYKRKLRHYVVYVAIYKGTCSKYRPFHKTLPRSSAFLNWISVRFYETDCMSSFTQYVVAIILSIGRLQ